MKISKEGIQVSSRTIPIAIVAVVLLVLAAGIVYAASTSFTTYVSGTTTSSTTTVTSGTATSTEIVVTQNTELLYTEIVAATVTTITSYSSTITTINCPLAPYC